MKTFKMFLFAATLLVALSACTENPINPTDDNSNTTIALPDPTNGGLDYYHRTKEYGGPNGYNIVITDHSIWGTIIYCRNAGEKYCPKTVSSIEHKTTLPTIDYLNAANQAYSKVVNGQLTGLDINPETGLSTRWSSTSNDTTTAKSDVKVWVTSNGEPQL